MYYNFYKVSLVAAVVGSLLFFQNCSPIKFSELPNEAVDVSCSSDNCAASSDSPSLQPVPANTLPSEVVDGSSGGGTSTSTPFCKVISLNGVTSSSARWTLPYGAALSWAVDSKGYTSLRQTNVVTVGGSSYANNTPVDWGNAHGNFTDSASYMTSVANTYFSLSPGAKKLSVAYNVQGKNTSGVWEGCYKGTVNIERSCSVVGATDQISTTSSTVFKVSSIGYPHLGQRNKLYNAATGALIADNPAVAHWGMTNGQINVSGKEFEGLFPVGVAKIRIDYEIVGSSDGLQWGACGNVVSLYVTK